MPLIEPPTPILILSYHHCDLHCCHLDNYGPHKAAFLQRLQQIEAGFQGPSPRRVWLNLDESRLDQDTLLQTAQALARLRPKILKLACIGLGRSRRPFEKRLTQALSGAPLPRAYFTDAEQAKAWLV